MKNKLEILGAAQAFGFGGISEMCAIEGALRLEPRLENATVYLREEKQFDAVLWGSRERFKMFTGDLFSNQQLVHLDTVISSYDTEAVFYGWFRDLPVYFYDGMLWFWDFQKYQDQVDGELAKLEKIKASENSEALKEIYSDYLKKDFHFTVLIAYYLAKNVYARGALSVSERISSLRKIGEKVKVIGAMIDPSIDPAEKNTTGEHILITLSGSLAPTLSFDQNMIFARGALGFALEAQSSSDLDIPFVFSCHPKIFAKLKEEGALDSLPPHFQVHPGFPYEKNLQMIRDAYAVFASPGFSSVQEAAHFRTPLFFLPEQNGGQPTGYTTLKNSGYPSEHNLTVTDRVYGGECTFGDYETPRLYEGVKYLFSPEMALIRENVLKKFFEVIKDPGAKKSLIQGQRNAVSHMIGGFDGASEMVSDLSDDLLG